MPWSDPSLEAIARLLAERTGLSFSSARQESAEMSIRRAMTRAGLNDPGRYLARLQTDTQLFDDLVVELTVGETYFFRESGQFEHIRQEILPEVLRRRGGEHVVRLWSAGCASGEEAYTLAIVLEQEGLGERCHILATDISRAALARARRAVYGSWSLRGEGAALARPYLRPGGVPGLMGNPSYVLADHIRRRVSLEHLNLARDVYPSFATGTWGMDLILCRNVLIYFDRETVRNVARRLYESLAPGGWLLTASSDPPLASDAPYEVVVTKNGVFYRRGLGLPQPERPPDLPSLLTATHQPVPAPAPVRVPRPLPPRRSSPPPPPVDPLAEAQRLQAAGDYAGAARLTQNLPGEEAATLHVRALANVDAAAAERACAAAVERFPLSAGLRYLHALFLLELGRDGEAVQAVQRVLYLDRSLAVAHFTLGSILWRQGDWSGARRAFRNALRLSAARPPEEAVPLGDGEHAGRLAEAAAAQLAIVDANREEAR